MKTKKLSKKIIRSLLPARLKDAHKGSFGHVLILAGSPGMSGAPVLAANGALRAGAGLVTIGVPESIAQITAKKARPEAMVLALPAGRDGCFSPAGIKKIREFVLRRKVSAVAAGPGMRVTAGTRKLVRDIINLTGVNVVLDADGLNALKGKKILLTAKAKIAVTPHPGEFGRLTGAKLPDVKGKRAILAGIFARETGVVCVLKGSGTIITDGKTTFMNTTGNPGMAGGGSGDVLTGVIAALSGQVEGRSLFNASCAGVYLHGLAGDIAARKKTMVSMTAMDIAENLPEAFRMAFGRKI